MNETVAAHLRSWAKGMYTTEAAAELLLRGFNGRFADTGNPWIGSFNHHGHWVDFAAIPHNVGALSSGERAYLILAASIGSIEVRANLGDLIAGLDRKHLQLVLAAIAQANGSHEHSALIFHPGTGTASIVRETTLIAWPDAVSVDNRQ